MKTYFHRDSIDVILYIIMVRKHTIQRRQLADVDEKKHVVRLGRE